MKLKLIFDGDLIADAYKDNRTGIFRVSCELLNELTKRDDIELFYSHLSFFNRETTTEELDLFFAKNNIRIKPVNIRYRRKFLPFRKEKLFRFLYQKIGVFNYKNRISKKLVQSAQVFHSTYFPINENFKVFSHLKTVVTIHDLIPILFTDLHFTSGLIKDIIASVDADTHVICVSENTKKDLLAYAPHINPDHVFVSYLAASPDLFYPCHDEVRFSKIKEKYKLPKKYFLSLSTLEPRKNLDHLIRCFIRFITQNNIQDVGLVLVGSKGWDYESIFSEYENANHLKDKIIITGRVEDENLASIYSHAHSFYYMSLYEGFGLPPLEAMQCGTPVVVSNTSSLPEVVGDAGILLDPNDEIALIKTMQMLYSNETERKSLKDKVQQQARKFSWEKTAEEHLSIYKKMLKL